MCAQTQYLFSVHFDVRHIVLENCGHIYFGELVFAEDDEKTCLTTGAVADNYQFFTNRCHSCNQLIHGMNAYYYVNNKTINC